MTVDMLAATFFWPEGTRLHVREDAGPDSTGDDGAAAVSAADPLVEKPGETFWATVLRQVGWPLPSKPVTHS